MLRRVEKLVIYGRTRPHPPISILEVGLMELLLVRWFDDSEDASQVLQGWLFFPSG